MNNQNLRVNEKSASEDEIDILEFFVTITENIKLLLVGPLACGLLVLGISFLVPQTYESSFTLGTNNMNADTGQIQRLVLGIKSVEDVAEKINVGNGSPLTVKDIRKKTTSVINPINTEIKFKVEAPNAQEAYFLATALLDTAFKYKAELLSNEAALLNKYNQSLATIIKIQNRLEKELEKSASDELLIRSYLAVIAQSTVLNELAVKQRLVVEGLNQIHAFEMPILQPKAVKPNKPTLFGLGVLISGFLFVLYIFIRKAFIINKSSKADLKLRKFKEI
jgi:capsular polysaccharide biosynthesis protein